MNEYITTGNLLRLNQLLMDRICDITGSEKSYTFAIDMSYIKYNYRFEDPNQLVILDDVGNSDWLFKIASYKDKGKVLLFGIENDLRFVMCYEDFKYFVIVLDKDLEV